jgi:hypothetical protein
MVRRMKTLEPFADLKLIDPDGGEHRLGDTWRDRPAVLVWLRHYG